MPSPYYKKKKDRFSEKKQQIYLLVSNKAIHLPHQTEKNKMTFIVNTYWWWCRLQLKRS